MNQSTLIGEPDARPGNYYVAAHRNGIEPETEHWLVAGPYTSHQEADRYLPAVRHEAEKRDARACWMHWITARTELSDVRKTPLGVFISA